MIARIAIATTVLAASVVAAKLISKKKEAPVSKPAPAPKFSESAFTIFCEIEINGASNFNGASYPAHRVSKLVHEQPNINFTKRQAVGYLANTTSILAFVANEGHRVVVTEFYRNEDGPSMRTLRIAYINSRNDCISSAEMQFKA